ncbi:uncharacterized protein LOC144103379 [Amblyomma americanum]
MPSHLCFFDPDLTRELVQSTLVQRKISIACVSFISFIPLNCLTSFHFYSLIKTHCKGLHGLPRKATLIHGCHNVLIHPNYLCKLPWVMLVHCSHSVLILCGALCKVARSQFHNREWHKVHEEAVHMN